MFAVPRLEIDLFLAQLHSLVKLLTKRWLVDATDKL